MKISILIFIGFLHLIACNNKQRTKTYTSNPINSDGANKISNSTLDTLNYINFFKNKSSYPNWTNSELYVAADENITLDFDPSIKRSILRYWESYSSGDSVFINSIYIKLDTNNNYVAYLMNFNYHQCENLSKYQIRFPDVMTGEMKCIINNLIIKKELNKKSTESVLQNLHSNIPWKDLNSKQIYNENPNTGFLRYIHYQKDSLIEYISNSYIESNQITHNVVNQFKLLIYK